MQPLVPLVFHNLPSLYPPSNDFLTKDCPRQYIIMGRYLCALLASDNTYDYETLSEGYICPPKHLTYMNYKFVNNNK